MENLKYQDGKLEILDQRLLPNEAKWLPIDMCFVFAFMEI